MERNRSIFLPFRRGTGGVSAGEGKAILLDLNTLEEREIQLPDGSKIVQVSMDRSGKRLIAAPEGDGDEISGVVFDVATLRPEISIPGLTWPTMSFSDDGKRLACFVRFKGRPGEFRIWDLE